MINEENLEYEVPKTIYPGGYFPYILDTIIWDGSFFIFFKILKYEVHPFIFAVCLLACCFALIYLVNTISLIMKKIYIEITDEYFEIKTNFRYRRINIKDIKLVTTISTGSRMFASRKISIKDNNSYNWRPKDIMLYKAWFSKKDIKKMKEILSSMNPEIKWDI